MSLLCRLAFIAQLFSSEFLAATGHQCVFHGQVVHKFEAWSGDEPRLTNSVDRNRSTDGKHVWGGHALSASADSSIANQHNHRTTMPCPDLKLPWVPDPAFHLESVTLV